MGANPDRVDSALTHVTAVFSLYITQRQNVVNFYLAAVALLAVAYSGAVDKPQWPVAVGVAVLGVLASAGADVQDQRQKEVVQVAETALTLLQGLVAQQLSEQLGGGDIRVGALDGLQIQQQIDSAGTRSHWSGADRSSARCTPRWVSCSCSQRSTP